LQTFQNHFSFLPVYWQIRFSGLKNNEEKFATILVVLCCCCVLVLFFGIIIKDCLCVAEKKRGYKESTAAAAAAADNLSLQSYKYPLIMLGNVFCCAVLLCSLITQSVATEMPTNIDGYYSVKEGHHYANKTTAM
jgi:hypothetical protein